ncbi:MAG TPA: M56 family metallopeptidase [Steroidobacteraceae bacterium]|jgi:beta-lactamase regulating signal transducer with metallopeptidase domain
MSTPILLEAAVRSLIMGVIIFGALRLLRIDQVRARRTAWLLALIGALAMPVLVSAQIGPRLLPEFSPAALAAISVVNIPPAQPAGAQDRVSIAPSRAITVPLPQNEEEEGGAGADAATTVLSLVVFGYCTVAAVLSLRLCTGVGFALRLRNQAERIVFPFDPQLDVRASDRIATPVTIASSVLLPLTHTSWDGATLRVVLSHERAHVRQQDFLVHALAGLHCAIFWFNPFSWWLQRQLSELGEALSDRAAVDQAESRTSYAETLLAFAAHARSPLAAVAMANRSSLTSRIERLLNDGGFERSFAEKARLPFVAAGFSMLALVASTSMTRVHAAPSSTWAVPEVPAVSVAPAAVAPLAPLAPPVPMAALAPLTPPAPVARPAPSPPPPDEGILAIHTDHSDLTINSGAQLPRQSGNYIYFQHDGMPYVIQDPEVLTQAQTLLAPMKELREKQRSLGAQQRQLGAQQRALGQQQRFARTVDGEQFKREMAQLKESIKQMDLKEAQINEKVLEELQAHLGEIQSQVGAIQAQLGAEFGRLGEEQGKLGEEQGKLGEQQAQLGEQQRKLMDDTMRQLQPILEQAIRDGKGKPLQ